ncbi:hypothetical protein M1466_03465 [Candidatus Dependentiae bacterium]|nr:hypothetical protein [Candidatus Dependentiae bacterium]
MTLYDWSLEGPVAPAIDTWITILAIGAALLLVGGAVYWYWHWRRRWFLTPSGRLYGTLQHIMAQTAQGQLKPGIGMTLALAACKQYWLKTEQQPVLSMTDQELHEFLLARSDQLSQAALCLLALGSRFEQQGPTAERVVDAIALAQTAVWRK